VNPTDCADTIAVVTGEIDVVLFDLGGVLFDFGGVDAMKSLASIGDDQELWRRWLTCRWVRTFERGDCSAEEFAHGVVGDWALRIASEEFLESFRSWVGGPLDGAHALVDETRRQVQVGCLSNTNVLHWGDHERRWDILRRFDNRFLSFQMGCVKPDREIFEQAAQALDRPPDRVLFLDDNTVNVEGATAAGFRAVHAVGVDEARRRLAAAGILPGDRRDVRAARARA
jgi:HAD superfamily hydrolase (TIGR01509 family)